MSAEQVELRNVQTRKDVTHAWMIDLPPYACTRDLCPGAHIGLLLMAIMDHDDMRLQLVVSEDPDHDPVALTLTKPQIAELVEDLTNCLDVLP